MESIEVTVAKENATEFSEKFGDINEKFLKKGFPVLVATKHDYIPTEDDDRDPESMNEKFDFYTISSSWNGMNLADEPCDFQGVVNFVDMHDDNSRIVTCDNEEVGAILRSEKLVCDCCKKDITRGKYLAFLKTGKPVNRDNVIILGRNCAKNYFPFNVDIYLGNLVTVYSALEDDYNFDGVYRRHCETHVETRWLAFAVGKVTNNYTVYHKADDELNQPTRALVGDYLDDYKDKYGHRFRDDYEDIPVMDFEEMEKMLINAYQNPTYNEFNMNIHSVMFDSENNLRHEISKKYLGIAIYAFVGARRQADKAKAKELEHRADMVSDFVGNVGDKFEMTLTYIKSIWFESQFGYSAFHFFKDDNGNMFKWSSANTVGRTVVKTNNCGEYKEFEECQPNDKVTLKGTIKDHSEYKGVKQTVITRCKIIA